MNYEKIGQVITDNLTAELSYNGTVLNDISINLQDDNK